MAEVPNTAFAQALAAIQEGSTNVDSRMPSYMVASDTMNMANQNRTFLEAALAAPETITKFVSVSMISGASQLYNIPADIGNMFGADIERVDTQEVISNLDSNLGEFYKEHKQGADLAGFLVSSLVPGTAGVRLLNVGQKSLRGAISAGKFGENTGKALGLLAPQRAIATKRALKEVLAGTSPASLTNRNALKAIGAGIGQGALEALAFEVAVAATLFKSPILENQDFGDFVANVAFGAGVFGLVGGTLNAVKINSQINRAADKAALADRPWTSIAEPAAASKGYEKVVLDFEQLNNIPKIPAGTSAERTAKLNAATDTKRTILENRIRTNLGELAEGDQEVAEALFQGFKGASFNAQQAGTVGLVQVTRFGAKAKLFTTAEKLEGKIKSGKASTEEIAQFSESTLATSYVKLWGEDAGRMMTDAPTITSLADTLKIGQKIKVTSTSVKAGDKKFNFNIGANVTKGGKAQKAKQWDILSANALEANARYIWAQGLKRFTPTVTNPVKINVNDIPLMEKVMAQNTAEEFQFIKFSGLAEGETITHAGMKEFLGAKKVELANRLLEVEGTKATLLKAGTKPHNQDEIAAIVNVKSSLLNGEVRLTEEAGLHLDDMLALQSHANAYTEQLIKQGVRKETDGIVDIWKVPQHLKLTYDTQPFANMNNHVIENMVIIKEQQKLYQEGTSRASAAVLGKDYSKLEDISSGKVFAGAVPSGAGAGFASAASHNYGTLAASVENIGSVTSRMIAGAKESARGTLEPLLYKLANNSDASIEWSTLNARVRAIEGEYALNAAGDALEPLMIVRWNKAAKAAAEAGEPIPPRPTLTNPAMELRIELQTKEVRDLAKAHIEVNQVRTEGLAGIRTAQGMQFNRAPEAFYPIPINPKEFPHFALVIDESITSGNHSKTLFAASAKELEGMIGKLKENPQLKILTKNEAEAYHKSRGTWDYEKTLNNNYLDTAAHRKGVSAPFIVSTDPKKITTEMLEWHMQRETGLIREAVTAKYEVQFNELRRLGEGFTNVATSRFSDANLAKFADDAVKNPFADYIKTALAIRKTSDYPFWVNLNQMADSAFSKMHKTISKQIELPKTAAQVEAGLKATNDSLKKAGYKGAVYDESMEIFANAEAPRGALSAVVQKANSIMATVVLRWDALNAVNNAVSANVLLGAETSAVIKAIGRGDTAAVGALAKLTQIKVPGVDGTIFAPEKLIGNAIRKFNRSSDEMQFYKDNGYITSISDQYRNALDSLSYTPRESVKNWNGRVDKLHDSLRSLADKGEKWTGNKLAEEFNRFVAADVMKQMTDIAVTRNLMTGKEQLAYINTFVNRTQGNYLAAQRPMMFSGPIGQAIGLFQTYQFNLMQQLLRHVGEGRGRDAMTLLGLQGTIHGMNGLPGFDAINTHLIGNASGNKEHRDAYDATYGIAGKEGGDWLMYGLASNAMGLLHPDLKVNLYTRGDINPRSITLVPVNPANVPIVSATAKVLGNMFNTAKKLAAGGDVTTTLLQGLEHNGLSRPLAGLAQTLEGLDNPLAATYSTSKRGNVIASNDFLSLANLGRLVGGKPFDEAVAIDASYRFKAYGLVDQKKRNILGQAIKTTMIAGKDPSQDQIEDFAMKYAEAGGRQEEFTKWMGQLYKTANLSQTNKIQQSLSSPFTQSMQTIMGGRELRDFTE